MYEEWGYVETITVLIFGLGVIISAKIPHHATNPSLPWEALSSWAQTGPWMDSRRQSSGGSFKIHYLPNNEVSWQPWCKKTCRQQWQIPNCREKAGSPVFISDFYKNYNPVPKNINGAKYADHVWDYVAPAVEDLYPEGDAIRQDDL